MADPTIQTFCCHHSPNGTDMANQVMDEFNTKSYNALCLFSSIIGMLGALYQILPREEYIRKNSAKRVRPIIIWLAVADLLASLGVFVRSALWLNYKTMMPKEDDTSNVLFCALTSAWTQYFYTATWIWTLCYAIDSHLLLRNKDSHTRLYHSASWGIPALLTSIGLTVLYYPSANCHNLRSLQGALLRVLPNYCATYLPIIIVMIANPIIYFFSSIDVKISVPLATGQITSRERNLVHSLKLKFALINVCFYVCWLPNIVNGILLWTLWFDLPINVIIVVWYIMALMNPLQALLNAIVYRRWTPGSPKIKMPFKMNCLHFKSDEPTAETPLLRHSRYASRLYLTDNPINSIGED